MESNEPAKMVTIALVCGMCGSDRLPRAARRVVYRLCPTCDAAPKGWRPYGN